MKIISPPSAAWAVAGLLFFGLLFGETNRSELPAAEKKTSAKSAAKNIVRTRDGLQAIYDFTSTTGDIVKDRSGVGKPLDLRIADSKAVHRSAGSLQVRSKTLIRSNLPATKITDSVRKSGEITIEAWLRPANRKQDGPARIVTLSQNGSRRSFTLGQDRNRYDVRFRTTKTNANGHPSLASVDRSLTNKPTHMVYTRDRSGRAILYLNGRKNSQITVRGETSKWDRSLHLALADEMSGDRAWIGTYYLVAIYNRTLTPEQVATHFKAGVATPALAHDVANPPPLPIEPGNGKLFETQIAPLLARHCVECHGPMAQEGELNLSQKIAALAGGESGPVITPGDSYGSLLWKAVKSNEMPQDRKPLSDSEKKLLQQWIDGGAVWSVNKIDPNVYARKRPKGADWLRRLTVPEYIETVRVATGVDIRKDARKLLPREMRADGFSNTAYNLNVDLEHVSAYSKLSETIVGRMDIERFAARFVVSRDLSEKNMRDLVSRMGKWLLRGPLDKKETAAYLRVSAAVIAEGGDYKEATGYIVEAMLQSPRFIYRVENQMGQDGSRSVNDYELASRLSYIIWGGPPDRELMRAAEAGELKVRARVSAQVKRMLKDSRAVDRSLQFASEWLDLGRLENLRPNVKRFPNWDPQLAEDMRRETRAFFKEVVWIQKRTLADLYNAQITFATSRLAKHYGLKPKGEGLLQYDVSSIPGRGGLLTQGSILTIGGDEASTVTRGLFVLKDVIRGSVKDPPPGIDTTAIPTRDGLTTRDVAEIRIANASCGGCHVKFEPLAFGLVKFDGLGTYRDQDEHGNKLRDDGKVHFPGDKNPTKYNSSAELMDLLAKSERVSETISWKVTQFALGRPLTSEDRPMLEKIHAATRKNGGTYVSLITAIVMSDLVQKIRTEKNP